jgi:hypothetical protein
MSWPDPQRRGPPFMLVLLVSLLVSMDFIFTRREICVKKIVLGCVSILIKAEGLIGMVLTVPKSAIPVIWVM